MDKQKLLKPAIIQCHAKLNLSLLIYKVRKDNYHPIRSIFQTIDLHDILTISTITKKELIITCENRDVPLDEKNILFKVYNLVSKYLPNGFIIDIKKQSQWVEDWEAVAVTLQDLLPILKTTTLL